MAAAGNQELSGIFLGWTGGTGLASYLIEVEHVTRRYMWIREETKLPASLRLVPGTRLRFTARPVGAKDRRYAEGMDGLLDAILQAEPPVERLEALYGAMREVLQSMEDGNCSSAIRHIAGSSSVAETWRRSVCAALRNRPFLLGGDTWALLSVGPRECQVILSPSPFRNRYEFALIFDLTGGATRLTGVRSLPPGEHLRLFYPE